MKEVIIGLGSNIGDRKKYLLEAVDILKKSIQDVKLSSIYQSPPWGYESDLDYYNMVLTGNSIMGAEALLNHLHNIESDLGRDRKAGGPRYVNRTIDLDLLHYGREVLKTDQIEIPHPRMWDRAFVMLPLLELKPDYTWEGKNNTIKKWKENGANSSECTRI